MLRTLLVKLREQGIDFMSPHRRDATSVMRVLSRMFQGIEVRAILDCGAHHGRIALLFSGMFPKARIYCFEPTPDTRTVLRGNVGGTPSIEIVEAAIGDQPGELTMHIFPDEQTNTLSSAAWRGEAKPQKSVQVKVVRLDDFCAEKGVDHVNIIKMDIEGYELHGLKGLERMLRAQQVDVIYCEVRFEPPAPECTHFLELAGHLRERGYRFFGFYDSIYDKSLKYDWGDVVFVSDRFLAEYRKRIGMS